MPTDQAFIYRTMNIGPETTPGTEVSPTKKLASLSFSPTPNPTVNTFAPSGYALDTVAATNGEQTDFSLTGLGVYDEIPYFWASLLKNTTPTTPGGTLPRLWTFDYSSTSANTQKTYSYEIGDTARAQCGAGLVITQGNVAVSFRQGMQLSGNAIGTKLLDMKTAYLQITGGSPTTGTWSFTLGAQVASGLSKTITSSALQTALEALSNVGAGQVAVTGGPLGTTPLTIKWIGTYLNTAVPAISVADTFDVGDATVYYTYPVTTTPALIPITGQSFNYYTATSYAGLSGAAKHTRLFNYGLQIGNRAAPIYPMNTDYNGTYAATIENKPNTQVTFSVGADDVGMGFLQNLRQNDTIFLRARADGAASSIESGYAYYHQIDQAVKLTKVSEIKSGEGGIAQIDYTGVLVHDATWGKGLSVSVQNKLASL